MNPKDMTHVELLSEAMASMLDIGACYEGLEQERADSDVIRVELLRRLDEADALRKENEELRNVLDYVASFISIEDVGDDVACPGVVISSERFEEHATINGVLGFDKCEHPFTQPLVDVLKRAVHAKESETSHE